MTTTSSVGMSLRLLLAMMSAAVPITAQKLPPCPSKCSCTTSLVCRDLGEQSRAPDLAVAVPVDMPSFLYLRFVGRTKIRTIQSRAFSGLRVQWLRFAELGVHDIESRAFLGIIDLRHINLHGNHISGNVDSGTFAVNTKLISLNVSNNDIDSISSNAFSLVGGSSLTDLRLAGNRLTVLPARVFANLTGLRHLDLSGNRLTNLTRPLFDNLPSLKRLLLGNNRISNIESTLFSSLSRLEQLSLDNNKLSSLPASVFSRLSSLQTLTLRGNRLSAIHSNVFPYSSPGTQAYSGLQTLKLDRNRIVELKQIGISGISSLRTLTLAANRLEEISVGYFVGLSNIDVLDLSRNNISNRLNASSFDGLTSLTSLNLSSNNIERVSARTFGDSLRTLDLSENNLEYVSHRVFENARKLTNLYLRKNGYRRVSIGMFNEIASLENLDLSNNAIENIFSRSFENMTSLKRIDLSKNNISSIPTSIFFNTSQLSHVALDENLLSTIPVDVISNLSNLRNITLAHNRITKLQALQSPSVDIFRLTGNLVSNIVDGAFVGTPQLRQLYLDQNLLSTITIAMFSGLDFLNHLDLSDNLISTIDIGSFQSMQYLTYLSLHGNRLTSIVPGTFTGLLAINSLVLSANRLVSNITEGLLEIGSLQDLILDDNDIISFDVNHTYFTDQKPGLRRLSLRRNMISKLQFGHGSSYSFSYLDLGENQITEEIFHILKHTHMRFLDTLKLDSNDIGSVPTVSGINESLTELDLTNNALTDSSLATLVQLRQLQRLRLDGNMISKLSVADWGLLADSLSVLSLSNNLLTSLDQIGRLYSLTQLNADHNLIESISDSTFQLLYDLDAVSLRGNRLTTIGQFALRGLEHKCTQLDLSSNDIAFIHPEAFRRLKNIKRLNLSNNAVSEMVLPPIMNQLTELLLSNNRLRRFPDELRDFRSISVLSLYNNMIESMPPVDIGNEFGVRLVDLSYNRLHSVDEIHLIGSLNVVNLGENDLVDIGAGVLADMTFIGELNLSGNALGRLPVAVTVVSGPIARLHADRCSLTSLDGWPVDSVLSTHLVELTLSGNRLTALPLSVMALLAITSMQHLDVRGNLLSTLNGEIFAPSESRWNPKDLRRLSLAGNPWHCDCQLVWMRTLRSRGIVVDNATCWTPLPTAGQLVVCFNISTNGIDTCLLPPVPAVDKEILEYDSPSEDTCEPTVHAGLDFKRSLPAGCREAANCRYCFYSQAKNQVFAPQG